MQLKIEGVLTTQDESKLQEPIEIMSSDEETENANPPKQPDGQSAKDSDIPRPRRSERLNAWQTTTAKYEVTNSPQNRVLKGLSSFSHREKANNRLMQSHSE